MQILTVLQISFEVVTETEYLQVSGLVNGCWMRQFYPFNLQYESQFDAGQYRFKVRI